MAVPCLPSQPAHRRTKARGLPIESSTQKGVSSQGAGAERTTSTKGNLKDIECFQCGPHHGAHIVTATHKAAPKHQGWAVLMILVSYAAPASTTPTAVPQAAGGQGREAPSRKWHRQSCGPGGGARGCCATGWRLAEGETWVSGSWAQHAGYWGRGLPELALPTFPA